MPYRPNIGFDNIERWFGVSWFGIHAMGLGRAAQELGGMPTFWWGLMKPNAKKISEEVRPQTAYLAWKT